MADDLGISNHLTTRGGVYQYVRRVPEDLRSAIPFPRVQQSLETRDPRHARGNEVELDRFWDERFDDVRRGKGLEVTSSGPAIVPTEDWTWPDWEALVTWFGACLAEEDWRARMSDVRGRTLGRDPDLAHLPWREDAVVKEHIGRGAKLSDISVRSYSAERLPLVQSYTRQVGVILSRTAPEFERFMAACLTAELAYLDLFQLREARRGGLGHPHPDTIQGRWRSPRPLDRNGISSAAASSTSAPTLPSAGETLKDCRTKWIDNRTRAKKQVRPDYLRDMDLIVAAFEVHADVSDIGQIRRKHLLVFRDHLEGKSDYNIATIAKTIGFVSALMRTAWKGFRG